MRALATNIERPQRQRCWILVYLIPSSTNELSLRDRHRIILLCVSYKFHVCIAFAYINYYLCLSLLLQKHQERFIPLFSGFSPVCIRWSTSGGSRQDYSWCRQFLSTIVGMLPKRGMIKGRRELSRFSWSLSHSGQGIAEKFHSTCAHRS